MKNLFLLAVAIIFTSCSTDGDNDNVLFQEEAVVVTTMDPAMQKMMSTNSTVNCIKYFGAGTRVDVSAGLTNPKVVFIADVPNTTMAVWKANYSVTLELQTLADCEDLTSGQGMVTRYTVGNVAIPAVNDPEIMLTLAQLPSTCYRWRYILNGITTSGAACSNVTAWDYEPLF